ncbi:hypothetical protein CALCODRAFT_257800 [Calocera cornea HHB12733]|uniref:Uncharacterized protein n=1 Tax=Calocera cornea HHB12733 TaxID=1353952 RepID=A0A165GKT0_9BASI|nr:hypothetical protein CALCODRAFT_257800 [Calocera cornea HHB12733]
MSMMLTLSGQTRYVIEWRAAKNELVFKIIDDVTIRRSLLPPASRLMTLSIQQSHHLLLVPVPQRPDPLPLNRFDTLNLALVKRMRARAERRVPPELVEKTMEAASPAPGCGGASRGRGGRAAVAGAGGTCGGRRGKKNEEEEEGTKQLGFGVWNEERGRGGG